MSKKILVADDDPLIVMLLSARLKANHYDVVVAADAVQAVDQAHKEKPDLILLDNRMPGGSGLEVINSLRHSPDTAATPIIIITATSGEEIRKEAFKQGATDFIAKPFHAPEMLEKIKNALAGC